MLLADALKAGAALHSLDLHANALPPQAAAPLAEVLRCGCSGDDDDDDGGRDGGGAGGAGHAGAVDADALMAAALAPTPSLRELLLQDNQLGPAGAALLADGLQHNRLLTNLDLQRNGIGEDAAALLDDAARGAHAELILWK